MVYSSVLVPLGASLVPRPFEGEEKGLVCACVNYMYPKKTRGAANNCTLFLPSSRDLVLILAEAKIELLTLNL